MRALLTADCYREASAYDAEQCAIFRDSFQLAGLAEDVQRDASWLRTEVGGRSVVLQNFGGELRAFRNVCAHRQNRLRTESAGCGALRCAYHGWNYGADGRPRGIPERGGFSAQEIAEARLITYEVVRLGPLVFVREGSRTDRQAAQDLAEQLGPIEPHLSQMLAAAGSAFSRFSLELRCNWKVLVENSIEGYHVASVHPETIGPLQHREAECTLVGGSSLSVFDARPNARRDLLLARALPERSMASTGYFHGLLFPNTTVATSQGAFFIVSRTVPLSAQRCRLDVFLLGASHEPSAESLALTPAVDSMNEAFVRRTFTEDAAICESVQSGLEDAEGLSLLHDIHERRVLAFQTKIAELLSRPNR